LLPPIRTDRRRAIPRQGASISVIIPAYNEERTILKVLELVRANAVEDFPLEIIVVDDGSKDRTRELLEQNPGMYDKFLPLARNGGKGVAVKEGIRAATGDLVLIQDADLEYEPADYPVLFRPLRIENADMVIGSRMVAPQLTRVYYFWHKIGNKLITLLFNVLFNTTFTDLYSGFFVFRRSLVDVDKLKIDGWGQHAEILCMVVPRCRGVYEVPISYMGRTYDEGKKIRPQHILGVFYAIIAGWFR
jgi:glycosyltransferase involved in cell wall biosynthesis